MSNKLVRLLSKLEQQLAAGDLARAESSINKALKIKPRDAQLWHQLGAVRFSSGDPASACKAFERAVKFDERNHVLLSDLGAMYLHLNRYSDAALQFEKALEIAPEFLDAKYNLATALVKSQNYATAIFLFRQVVQELPEHFEARFNLGLALSHQGNYKEAITALRAAEHLSAHNPVLQVELARCYRNIKDYAAARSEFEKLDNEELDSEVLLELAEVTYLAGDPESAIAYLEREISESNLFRRQLLLGDIYLNVGELLKAEEIFFGRTRCGRS